MKSLAGAVLIGWVMATCAVSLSAGAEELRVDGWASGQVAGYQGGFAAGEIGAVRLTPTGPCPCVVTGATFLYGGGASGVTREIDLVVWDDNGSTQPGTERYRNSFQVTAADDMLTQIDLNNQGILVDGPFRIGLEFKDAGMPSIARDSDGSITAAANFIFANGLGWVQSADLGLTGDWVIRAEVQPQGDVLSELKNDAWPPSTAAGFQGGFVTGEMAAVRVEPEGNCPCTVNALAVLFGGGPGTRSAVLRVWDDIGQLAPGNELLSRTVDLVSENASINLLDLSADSLQVDGPFRFGFEFTHDGFPSVARDDNGITADRNFINAQGVGWAESSTLAVAGDWIMRAIVTDTLGQVSELGNDNWAASEVASFQSGFSAGEIAASRFVPGFDCPCRIDGSRLLFGGAQTGTNITLRVWEDGALTGSPGSEVFSRVQQLVGANLVLNEIDLTGEGIWVQGPFRVGVEFSQSGLPSIARDHDGVVAGRNFIRLDTGPWVDSTTQGLAGDWILRATVFREVVLRADFE